MVELYALGKKIEILLGYIITPTHNLSSRYRFLFLINERYGLISPQVHFQAIV